MSKKHKNQLAAQGCFVPSVPDIEENDFMLVL